MKGAASWIALALALVSGLVAAGAYYRVRNAAPEGPFDPAAVDTLKRRVAHLEAEVARLSGDKGASMPPAPPGTPHPQDSEVADLRRRIEILERRPPTTPQGFQDSTRNSPRGNPAAVEAQKKRFFDATRTDFDRAGALSSLRMFGGNKTDDVVDGAIALLGQAQEARTRALILRGLKGAENAKLVPVLVRTLAADADEDVRVEAADTLGDYKTQSEAKAALEQAVAGDASSKVRTRAERALGVPPKK
ncbi:MAG TPA: HEAT repeat domain-containing protein [Planctomycetota bacterium]|nr:HEAT repeat domain-containing protein [Planctomycetota bacterium]